MTAYESRQLGRRALLNVGTVLFTVGILITLGALVLLVVGELGFIKGGHADTIPPILAVTVGSTVVGYVFSRLGGNRINLLPRQLRNRRRESPKHPRSAKRP